MTSNRKLALSEKLMRALYRETPSAFVAIDQNGIVQAISQFAARFLGFPSSDLTGTALADLVSEPDRISWISQLKACFDTPHVLHHQELRLTKGDGEEMWVRLTSKALDDIVGGPLVLVAFEDTTKTRELNENLSYHACHDELTGLVNRTEFGSHLSRAVKDAHSEISTSLLAYLDLDQFKVINDACGHAAGDKLLQELSELLTSLIRAHDTLGRLGGDEFGVLLKDCPVDKGLLIVEALRKSVEDYRFLWLGKNYHIGVSIGVVLIDADTQSAEMLLSAADSARYGAKDQGRNQVRLHIENDQELVHRKGEMRWVTRLHHALEENRFELYFQDFARFDGQGSSTGRAFEILVRLRTRSGELVLPGEFLPAAERYNLVTKIDTWVLTHTLDFFENHPDQIKSVDLCSINLSGQSISNPDFIETVESLIAKSPLSFDQICLEITETAAMNNLGSVNQFLSKMRKLGVRVALDDFGSGFCSFQYLKHLEVDFIKIDGAFVKDMAKDSMDLAMVKSINEIGQQLGKQTIAEFVEDDETGSILQSLGVNYGQGFGIARPAPLENLFPSVVNH